MKLMFVGVSNIGKSTLLGKLKGESSAAKGWNERRDTKKTPSMFHSILYDL
jgi:ribosome biogenesis GTPase A